ncbi:hypothetical protein H0H92_009583 [Tricholoma furcatifolium]|nr:hypothetical protein H0H92_009583 [Tricholoma furcatifolium]
MWNVQDKLSKDGKPLCISIYADKTKLSSFGTAQHPIMARIDNLPEEILNGRGLGSTQVVGWLPILSDEESEKLKPDYVNFKRAVYHACFSHLLSTISEESYVGCIFNCGGTLRNLYPFVFVLAADYEEQCAMTLTRGVKSLFPCTVCLVSQQELCLLSKKHPRRTADEAMKALKLAEKATSKAARERILKPLGLRNVMNTFFSINNSDPFAACTFDKLHNNCHGLGRKHAFKKIKWLIKALPSGGRDESRSIGKQMENMPRWPTLHHFSRLFLSTEFADGNELRDIMKMFIFASHNVIGADEKSLEYVLLFHTTETIEAGHKAVEDFGRLLNAYDDVLSKLLPGYDDTSNHEDNSNDSGEENIINIDDEEADDSSNDNSNDDSSIDSEDSNNALESGDGNDGNDVGSWGSSS